MHVLLMGLSAPLAEGRSVALTLTFEKAGSVDVRVAVTKPGAMAPPQDHERRALRSGAPDSEARLSRKSRDNGLDSSH